ncbi:MAG: NUDIX domain-containing protein [Armatimonadota bacterium]
MESIDEIIPVVTAFVYSGDKIALVKRSNEVSTYKGLWAGFSGYIERLPLEQAWHELVVEAGLSRDQIKLKGIGIPLFVNDEYYSKKWLVFPFLFKLIKSAEIKLDWEASELEWITADQLSDKETVPGLSDALKRVWPNFGDQQFWDGLEEIATNKTHGATSLARKGLEVLGGYVQVNEVNLDRHKLLRAIRAFAAVRPVMGVFPNLASRLLLGMERDDGRFGIDVLITELIGAVNDSTALSVNNTIEGIKNKKKIFTLSYGEAVKNSLIEWNDENKSVIIAESLPGKEAFTLDECLRENGVDVSMVPDSEIEEAVKGCDAVLVGCDAITENNEIQNKAGTRIAVQTAAESSIPVYTVTQTFKITPPGWPTYIEREDSEEAKTHGQQLFDLTPIEWFHEVFTEEGSLTIGRLNQIRDELGSVELIPGS